MDTAELYPAYGRDYFDRYHAESAFMDDEPFTDDDDDKADPDGAGDDPPF